MNIDFTLRYVCTPQALIRLSQQVVIIEQGSHTSYINFYDTFDRRLFCKLLVLYYTDNHYYLRELNNYNILHSLYSTQILTRLQDFPKSELTEIIAPIIDVRALLTITSVYIKSTEYVVLNDDAKIVVKLLLQEYKNDLQDSEPIFYDLIVMPLKGYNKEAEHIQDLLAQQNVLLKNTDLYVELLLRQDKTIQIYSSKLDILLHPEMPAVEATKKILSHLLNTLKINESYLERDIDTEFLHDFRVAIRRARSAVGQLKGVFSVADTHKLKTELAYIGQLSNQLRDLDVYILTQDEYKNMLPKHLREYLEILFVFLHKKRSQAFTKFIADIQSSKYKQIIDDWHNFVTKAETTIDEESYNANIHIIELAKQSILNRYRKIIKSGKKILINQQDEALHALRIECKKLRYLLEFFTDLFSSEKMNLLLKQLRKLQNNLGEFNDLEVQQHYLQNIAHELSSELDDYTQTILAIGALVSVLNEKQKRIKSKFADVFNEFTTQEETVESLVDSE